MRWWLVLLLVLLLPALSCSRKSARARESRAAPPAAVAADRTEEKRAAAGGQQEITLVPSVPQSSSPGQAPARKQSEEEKLLLLEARPRLPADFKIGPLADVLENDKAEREAIAAARRFLNSLREGSTASETLLIDTREQLKASLDYYLSRGLVPLDYRLGTLSFAQDQNAQASAWLNVRLFGSPGVSEGELYLEKSESGRWYVSDLQLNLERLGQTYGRAEEKYFPSTYGWGIE